MILGKLFQFIGTIWVFRSLLSDCLNLEEVRLCIFFINAHNTSNFIFQESLHYKGTKIHRIVKDFVIQMGDITVGDGTGGKVTVFTPIC